MWQKSRSLKKQRGFIFAALAAASIVSSVIGKKKQDKATKIQGNLQALQNDKSRKLALKEYRLAKAQAISAITGSGVVDSSAQRGITGSLTSQVQENLDFSKREEALGADISKKLNQASTYNFIAGALQTGAGIANSAKDLRTEEPKNPSPKSPFLKGNNAS